jgi:hypothetical protein
LEFDGHKRLKAQQPSFTELSLGQEKFERGITSPENLYYFVNIPTGNFKVEVSWLGVFYNLKVDLTLANDSSFSQIIVSSHENQGRTAKVTFHIDQERTIYLNVSLTDDFLIPVDIKVVIGSNRPALNISLITFVIIISLVAALTIVIIYMKKKRLLNH